MKHFYKLLMLAFLFPQLLKAQNNFKPGYIVNLKGDTLHGLIDFKEWDNNPVTIAFKSATGTTAMDYTAETIRAFGIAGFEYYLTQTLPISQEKVDVNLAMTKNSDTVAITKTVFLKVLSKGNTVTLYSFTDDIKQRFYIQTATSAIQELTYKVYYEENTLKTISRYRVQLQNIAQQSGNTAIARQIAGANYTQTDLLKIVKGINGNDGGLILTQADYPSSRFFIGVGANYGTLQFFGTGGPIADGTKQSNFTPEVNFGIDLYANKNTQIVVFRLQVSAMNSKYEFADLGTAGVTSSLEFKQLTFSVKPLVIYNFYYTDKFKAFVSSGINANFSTYKNNFQYQVTGFAPTTSELYKNFAKFWPSVPLTAGIAINNKLEINVGYVLPASIIGGVNAGNTVNLRVTEAYYHAGINYFF